QDQTVHVSIKVRDPDGVNFSGREVSLDHLDVIQGLISTATQTPTNNNPSAKVIKQFHAADWQVDAQGYITVSFNLPVSNSSYFRIRGTNTNDLEPSPDEPGENPWADLWFYTNPVFLIRSSG
ncbi:MAG: phosphoesterase, partial [Pseudomonadota bacterium]|nr:phosphoesterase [Pseudomonadota bacterium]